ncbi:oxygenase MpaB family protein [Frondihabitans sp. VKM Ac-2883]|uniref:oxygenase MpaB family protein n=1 Tax=Frondihabitans sp. VKM Ac-2883 TaxID=2783823 RepID=UPI00188D3ED9|nr:oxygenase MpaB family protein [Frondihabitans sp. VKM Ac-2883]MBF4577184.1 DUF2236 domain-containing protein [Frondihabitans sp. VKM Ac-2883]
MVRIDPVSEAVLLLGAGRAILLQLARPDVGHGVARHSDFARNPMGRLHGTLMYVYAVMAGTEADREAAAGFVSRMHTPVRGTDEGVVYDARDPEAQLWVAATLYDTAMRIHARVLGHLPEAEADRLYERYAALGTALDVPPGMWPESRAAFRQYWDDSCARLEVDGTVREQAEALWRASEAPWWVRRVMPLVRFVTAGLLPPRVRAEFELPWSVRRERRADLLWRGVGVVYPRVPGVVRTWPQRYYLGRLRGIVAAAQEPPEA